MEAKVNKQALDNLLLNELDILKDGQSKLIVKLLENLKQTYKTTNKVDSINDKDYKLLEQLGISFFHLSTCLGRIYYANLLVDKYNKGVKFLKNSIDNEAEMLEDYVQKDWILFT